MGLDNAGLAFGLVVAAGLATSVGACLAFLVRVSNLRVLSISLGISAGVMLYVSLVEIFGTKSVGSFVEGGYSQDEATRYATLTLFGGMVLTWLLDRVVHMVLHISDAWGQRRAQKHQAAEAATEVQASASVTNAGAVLPNAVVLAETGGEVTVHTSSADVEMAAGASGLQHRAVPSCAGHSHGLHPPGPSKDIDCGTPTSANGLAHLGGCGGHRGDGAADDRHHPEIALPADAPPVVVEMTKVEGCHHNSLRRMSLLSALAVGIHNFPEGLATFVGTIADPKAGVAIAVAIALHNIPEGIVVAMPIYYATGSRWQGFLWSTVSGVSEIMGGVIGYVILSSNVSDPPIMYAIIFGIVAGMMIYISIQELIPTALSYDRNNVYVSRCAMLGMAIMAASLVLFTL